MSSVFDKDRDEARYETRRAMRTGECDRPHARLPLPAVPARRVRTGGRGMTCPQDDDSCTDQTLCAACPKREES